MAFHRKLNYFAILISCSVLAHVSPAADSPFSPDVQQRLDTLKAGYESFVLNNIGTPYDEGLKALNAKVKPALERESNAAAQRKDLESLVRIKADIERVGQGQALTDSEAPPPDSLKHVYAAYKIELGKLESAKKASFANAKQRYDKGLAQIQDEMTAAQKVAEALLVKKLRDELANADVPKAKAEEANSPPSDLAGQLVGKWLFTAGTFKMDKELFSDGTIFAGEIPGKWKIERNKLRIDYANGAWAEFNLPLKNGSLKGKSNKGENMIAEKK